MASTRLDISRGVEPVPVEVENGIDIHQSGLSSFVVSRLCGSFSGKRIFSLNGLWSHSVQSFLLLVKIFTE
jgi:hypothetical protein